MLKIFFEKMLQKNLTFSIAGKILRNPLINNGKPAILRIVYCR